MIFRMQLRRILVIIDSSATNREVEGEAWSANCRSSTVNPVSPPNYMQPTSSELGRCNGTYLMEQLIDQNSGVRILNSR